MFSRFVRSRSVASISAIVISAAQLVGCAGANGELSDEDGATASVEQAVSAPNDTNFGLQWALNNTGQTVPLDSNGDFTLAGTRNVDLRILKAWDVTQGSSSVLVAIIDQTRVDLAHPDLQASAWKNAAEIPGNGRDDDGNGFVDDYYGYDFIAGSGAVDDTSGANSDHQTHLSGIIAATKGNGAGIAGVAPGIKVMHLRASAGDATQITAAIDYAKRYGAKIINLSQGGGPAYNIAAVSNKIAAESQILFVCSAGNTGTSKFNYPSSFPAANILSVANADVKGMLWRSSNYGPGYVDIAAPGLAIYSTLPGNDYGYMTGTSQAAAHASGVAALLLSANSALTPTGIIQRLKDTGMRVPYMGSLLGTTAVLDAEAALNQVLNVQLTATSIPGRITLSWQSVPGATRYQVDRDGSMVDNQLSTTFVHSGLTRNSTHIYRVRAMVNGVYGKWTYRILKAASNESVVETLSPAVEPPRDAQGNYLPNLNTFTTVQKSGSLYFRLHFTKVDLSSNPLGDGLLLTSSEAYPRDNRYNGGDALFTGAFWSLWFAAPSADLSFTTNESGGAFGYKVDQIEYVMP